jgi:hypothetical protein
VHGWKLGDSLASVHQDKHSKLAGIWAFAPSEVVTATFQSFRACLAQLPALPEQRSDHRPEDIPPSRRGKPRHPARRSHSPSTVALQGPVLLAFKPDQDPRGY